MHALIERYGHPVDAPVLPPCNMQRSYDRYYSSGLYASRYPRPNPHLFHLIRGELALAGGRVLDFGCGSGRYAVPLACLPGVSVFAYDISPAAIRELSSRCGEMTERRGAPVPLDLLCGSLEDLDKRLRDDDGFDLVTLLFGVLGHIEGRARRVSVLRSLGARLRPGGRLIATVPNRARRFRAEQMMAQPLVAEGLLEDGDIRYERRSDGQSIELFYHLYSLSEFRSELAEAGFVVSRVAAESVMTERAVLASPLCAAADRALCRVLPTPLAYGFVAVAHPA